METPVKMSDEKVRRIVMLEEVVEREERAEAERPWRVTVSTAIGWEKGGGGRGRGRYRFEFDDEFLG